MLSRLESQPPRTWLAALALASLAYTTTGCGGGTAKPPADAARTADTPADAADLPPPAYEAALPEGVRAVMFTPFSGDVA
jgi:hypothetical protein